jgi:hypothetical protein
MHLAKHNVVVLEQPPYSPEMSPTHFFLFPRLKSVLKGKRLANAEEVTAKAIRALPEVSKNGLQEYFQGNYFEGNIVKAD